RDARDDGWLHLVRSCRGVPGMYHGGVMDKPVQGQGSPAGMVPELMADGAVQALGSRAMTAIEDRSFRDRFLTPRVARAITAPTSILLLGGVAAAGILAGGPIVGAVLGVGAYAGRVLAAVPRRGRADEIDA